VQLALLGCSGYVVVGNSLSNPMVGNVLMPAMSEDTDIWFTPMFFRDVWGWRRAFARMREVMWEGDAG